MLQKCGPLKNKHFQQVLKDLMVGVYACSYNIQLQMSLWSFLSSANRKH